MNSNIWYVANKKDCMRISITIRRDKDKTIQGNKTPQNSIAGTKEESKMSAGATLNFMIAVDSKEGCP